MKPTLEDLLSSLDDLLAKKDRAVSRAIDAAACQTAHDWKKKREAEDAFGEAREAFETALRTAVRA